MREIKFRAWCEGKHRNLMFSHGSMEYDITLDRGRYANVEGGEIFGTYESVPVMQYTGLKDKHGKEIYQGDIIKIRRDKEGFGFTIYVGFAEVLAQTCGYSFRCFSPSFAEIDAGMVDEDGELIAWDSSSLWHMDEPENIEVIGNIYENPELTTKE